MFAIRFALNIESDIKRGWSAWMNTRKTNLSFFLEVCKDFYPAYYEIEDKLKNSSNEELLAYFSDVLDIRVDPFTSEYCIVHHDGLSVFELESETKEEALEEAIEKINRIDVGWFGAATEGEIKIVKEIEENWWLLEVEDVTTEN